MIMRLFCVKTSAFLALAAAVSALAGCSATPSGDSAPPASASAAAAASPSPRPSPGTPSSAACADITRTVKAAETGAGAQARAKHSRYPAVSMTDLEQAAFADELDGGYGSRITADESAPGATAPLRAAERRLVADGRTWHDHFGETAADADQAGVLAAVQKIGKVCGS